MPFHLPLTREQIDAHIKRIGTVKGKTLHSMDWREPRKIVAPEPTEHQSQVALVSWWSFACNHYNLPEFSLYATPNGGKREKATAGKLKAEGVRAGIPDLFLAAGSPRDTEARGLYIEMKRHPNKPTPDQEVVLAYLRRAGYHAIVAYSTQEAQRAIEAYLKEPA